MALPGALEKIAWGAPTFRAGERPFAMYAERHHQDPRVALWCHAPTGAQQVLVHAEPERYFVPPYVGVKGWIGIDLERVGDAALRERVLDGYRRVAHPKRIAELDGTPVPERRRKA